MEQAWKGAVKLNEDGFQSPLVAVSVSADAVGVLLFKGTHDMTTGETTTQDISWGTSDGQICRGYLDNRTGEPQMPVIFGFRH